MDFKFSCGKCGSQVFKTRSKPQSLEDFYGAVCVKCGATITESEIKKQASQLAEKLARDAFRKAGFN